MLTRKLKTTPLNMATVYNIRAPRVKAKIAAATYIKKRYEKKVQTLTFVLQHIGDPFAQYIRVKRLNQIIVDA
jgi:hypothetical protein